MKVKTSITLSTEALRAVDKLAGRNGNRSRVIEAAVLEYAVAHERAARAARDQTIINQRARALNREALDVLGYQADV